MTGLFEILQKTIARDVGEDSEIWFLENQRDAVVLLPFLSPSVFSWRPTMMVSDKDLCINRVSFFNSFCTERETSWKCRTTEIWCSVFVYDILTYNRILIWFRREYVCLQQGTIYVTYPRILQQPRDIYFYEQDILISDFFIFPNLPLLTTFILN